MREVPPTPEPRVNLDKTAADELEQKGRCHNAFVCGYGVVGDLHLFTADQIRERDAIWAGMLEEARAAQRRYEFIRKMNVPQFADLYRRNISGEGRFDDLVDAAIRGKSEGE
jgi:hypothetical protein